MRRGLWGRSPAVTFVLGVAGLVACRGPIDASSVDEGTAPHPQGVAIDPVLSLPTAQRSAESEHGLVVLSEPMDPEPALRLVREFFDAVVAESIPDLTKVLDPAAHSRTTGKPPRPEPALPWWKRRFERLDYTALGGEVFYRRSEMDARTARDPDGRAARALPVSPREGEVVVVVPISGQAASKLFGPELTFLVRRSRPGAGVPSAQDPTAFPGQGSRPPSTSGSAADAPNAPNGNGFEPDARTEKIAELYEDFRLP